MSRSTIEMEFSCLMDELGIEMTMDAIKGSNEWEIYKAGFNRAVAEHNESIKKSLGIMDTAKRCFGDE